VTKQQVTPEPALRLVGVSKHYGPTAALDDVDLEVRFGEVHGLVGENGAGKSTLLGVLAGAVRPDAGAMWIDGVDYAPAGPADGLARGLATVYQELSLAPHLDAAENVSLGRLPRRGPLLDRAAMERTARAALDRLGAADVPLAVPVGRLSAAQRQLVEIARGLASGARVFVFDEPTSSLGRPEAERLLVLMEELRSDGAAVVFVSHALEEIERVCDRVTVLRDGCNAANFERGAFDDEALVRAMAGRELAAFERTRGTAHDEVLLHARRSDGRGQALTVRRGEIVGVAGLVGAGRTELLRAYFGLERDPNWVFEGRAASTPRAHWRGHAGSGGAGLVSEDRAHQGLALDRPIDENLCLPRLDRATRGFGWLAPNDLRRRATRWVDALGVRGAHDVRAPIRTLSGGNQQKVAVARLLEADSELLLLDEPTRGVDVGAKAEIYRLVADLAAGRDGAAPRGVLVVSSDLGELLALCDRIAVMVGGVLGAARPADELDEHALLLEATAARPRTEVLA
jgi:ribose transport system ATP-binding protein